MAKRILDRITRAIERDRAILRDRRAGLTLRELSARYNITVERCRQICTPDPLRSGPDIQRTLREHMRAWERVKHYVAVCQRWYGLGHLERARAALAKAEAWRAKVEEIEAKMRR